MSATVGAVEVPSVAVDVTVRWKSSFETVEFGVIVSADRVQVLTSTEWLRSVAVKLLGLSLRIAPVGMPDTTVARLASASAAPLSTSRSEERRAGEECRSRWSPYH